MRRELLIAAGVLVPFSLLVAAGFWFSPNEEMKPLPERQEAVPVAPFVSGPVVSPIQVVEKERISEPIQAVKAEVERCFLDRKLKAPHQVRVEFTPTPEGTFGRVVVSEQNPYLAACIEDVFAEMRWRPDGKTAYAPSNYTFSFDPSPD